jgi:hypothetical protein
MKRVIALAWAVDPLAFSVGFPPQFTVTENVLVAGEFPPAVFLSPPHPDKSKAPLAKTLSAAPNRLRFNSVPNCRPGRGALISHIWQPQRKY